MNNSIRIVQDYESNISLRRAIRQAYYLAKWVFAAQMLATVVFPVLASLGGLLLPDLRPYVVLVSLGAIALDSFYLDRVQKDRLKEGAKLTEAFDCAVLDMPWNNVLVGKPVSSVKAAEYSNDFKARAQSDDKLFGWYPVEAGLAPHIARVDCQMTNAQYDQRLRRWYQSAVVVLAAATMATLIVMAMQFNMSVADMVVTVIAPMAPILAWSVRESYRQGDAAKNLVEIEGNAGELWDAVKAGLQPQDAAAKSRVLQDVIYLHRLRSPLPIPFIYTLRRKALEARMYLSSSQRARGIDQ